MYLSSSAICPKTLRLKIYTINNASLTERFLSLVELLTIIKPSAILTEIEFDIVSVLSILQPQLPTIFLSPGFYTVPWFDKIKLQNLAIDENHFVGMIFLKSRIMSQKES